MIITKKFVVLNLPKTGSSFVRKVIKDIYYKRQKKLFVKLLSKFQINYFIFYEIMTEHPRLPNYKDQHGCFDQIPKQYNNKKILSVVRDPYLRLESLYKFKWWAKNPPVEIKKIKALFPNFPNLNLKQFLKMNLISNEQMKEKYDIDKNLKIGNQSIQFIRFFFKNHRKVLAELDEDYILKGYFKNDLCDVTLLKNENLNNELAQFLLENNFSEEEANSVLKHDKVNVTKSNFDKSLIGQELITFVNENEWILFEILKYKGLNYKND